MASIRIGRLTTWFNAWRDRRHDLPAAEADGLLEFERRVIAVANRMMAEAHASYLRRALPLLTSLDAHDECRQVFEGPAVQHVTGAAEGRTQPDVRLSVGAHSIIVVLVTLSELVLNAQAFAVYGESTLMTWVMALAIGLGIPAIAYVMAVELRQAVWSTTRTAIWSGVVLLVLVTLGGITYVRGAYLAATHEGVLLGHAIDVAYLAVNVLFFVCALLATYFAHDPVPGFIEAHQALDARNRAIADVHGRLNALGEEFKITQEDIRQRALGLIAYYRSVNRLGRSATPAYFTDDEHPDCVPLARLRNVTPIQIAMEAEA